MFSGIIEATARVVSLEKDQDNLHITMTCPFVHELKIDQSVSHNGVCLTVVRKTEDTYTVTAIRETLLKSNLGMLQVGSEVNLERSMKLDGRLDGHIVQGHVDTVAAVLGRQQVGGSLRLRISLESQYQKYVIEKGSIAINGVSLTVNAIDANGFEVNLIPHTADCTSLTLLKPGDRVNLEFDVVGKYVEKLLKPDANASLATLLKNQGFM